MRLHTIFVIISIEILLLIAVIVVFYISTYRSLAVMNRTIYTGEPVSSECGWVLNQDKEIFIKINATVKEGDLTLKVLDESNATIREFDSGDENLESMTLKKGKYHIRAESDYFRGSYNIKLYE